MRIEVVFNQEDATRLKQALGRSTSDVTAVAELLARAGAWEALALATGRAVPSTFAEAKSLRIFGLVQQGIDLSDVEALTAAIFKVPMSTAKRMVSAAIARYAVELQKALETSISAALDAALWNDEKKRWEMRVSSSFLRERILGAADALPVPDPSRVGGSIYRFADETYQAVRDAFGLSPRAQA